jgi:hypothetical protein
MSRPPGCAFLGPKAVTILGNLMSWNRNLTPVVVDSGSDITLISKDWYRKLELPPKVKSGQRVKLVQVTGSVTIDGFVTIPCYFNTSGGVVLMELEAYVVKGMSTPFILGNDFSDQYNVSILRDEGETTVRLGDPKYLIRAESSTSVSLVDQEGSSFTVTRSKADEQKQAKQRVHRAHQRQRRAEKAKENDTYVRAKGDWTIAPESGRKIPIQSSHLAKEGLLYAEKLINFHHRSDEFHAAPDTLLDLGTNELFLQVSNFSKKAVRIKDGDAIAVRRDPSTFLDAVEGMTKAEVEKKVAHALLIRSLVQDKELKHDPLHDLPGDEPVEGGPKTAESPNEDVAFEKLFEEVDIYSGLSENQQERIRQVVRDNLDAFGINGRLGHHADKVHIRFKEGSEPVSLPPFPQSPQKTAVMDEQINKWLELKVIEPSQSPWGAPAFITYRGDKPRMVIDYRKLNDRVIPDEFPLPRQDDILQALNGSQYLSTLDALAGFTQLEMDEESREPTAFRCHRGHFQFLRMPFGYRNGPSVFQRVMMNILSPYLWIFALVYIDDIVIYSKSFDEHIDHLDSVLRSIAASGITLAPSKCHLGYQSLALLGQKVSRLGVSTLKSKIDAIVDLAEPTNVKELQAFLGMMVYFSSFIPFFAWIVAPLFKLLKKGSQWQWTEIEQEAFDLSKEALTKAPVRAFAMPGRGYRLYSDACDYGLAAILQQVQPIAIRDLRGTKAYDKLRNAHDKQEAVPILVTPTQKGVNAGVEAQSWNASFEDTIVYVERVIAYWSRTLKPAERNYSPTEREALALKEGLIKFQAYIEGERVDAVTDHSALSWSRTFQNSNRRLLSWGSVFSAYQPHLHIVHRAGRVHSNVDPISRLKRRTPLQDGPVEDPIAPVIIEDKNSSPEHVYEQFRRRFDAKVHHLMAMQARAGRYGEIDPIQSTQIKVPKLIAEAGPKHLEWRSPRTLNLISSLEDKEIKEWIASYSSDKLAKIIIKQLRTETDPLTSQYTQYSMNDQGLLYFEDADRNLRLYVPESQRIGVIKEDHDELVNGAHAGYHRQYLRLAQTYFWPRMSRDIQEYVLSCDICQKAKPKKHLPYGMLQSIAIPSRPFEVVTFDFIPDLPKTKSGYTNIFVIVDKLTKYGMFIPTTTDVDALESGRLFREHVISRFGLPRQIIGDRDTRWTSSFWKELCKGLGVKLSLATAYHPQTDGQSEILNQTLETALRCFVGPERNDWDQHLNNFALSYNSTPHSATKVAPALLLFGFLPAAQLRNLRARPSAEVERGSTATPLEGDSRAADKNDQSKASDLDADLVLEQFRVNIVRARDALAFAQAQQRKSYNSGRIHREFDEGDKVLINNASLKLHRGIAGRGQKFLMKYDGPFTISEKLGPSTYRLNLPSSYGIYPVINIAHLEKYNESDPILGKRPNKPPERKDKAKPEWEVEKIIEERTRKKGRRLIKEYKIRWVGFSPSEDEWVPIGFLKNAQDRLRSWENSRRKGGYEKGSSIGQETKVGD